MLALVYFWLVLAPPLNSRLRAFLIAAGAVNLALLLLALAFGVFRG
jgi:hypothetical protein